MSVGRSVFYIFPKGRKVTFACSYRSTCFYLANVDSVDLYDLVSLPEPGRLRRRVGIDLPDELALTQYQFELAKKSFIHCWQIHALFAHAI